MTTTRAWMFALLVSLCPAAASAQPVQSDTAKRALALGYEADGLYARSRWSEAYERFAEADRLVHSPVFVLYMARCRKNAGRLLEARSIYQRVAAEKLPPDAPRPFREATSDAASELAEIDKRIPSIVVVVTGAPASDVTVRVADRVVPAGKPVPLDPVSHDVTATAGGRVAKKTIVLAEGGAPVRVELSLAAASAADTTEEGSLAPAIVALSFGVVGIGVGGITGALASSKTSDIEQGCTGDGHCPKAAQGDIDSANVLATTSTVAFVAGGVGLAAAVVLFLVRPGGSNRPAVAPTARGRMLVLGRF